MTFSLKQPHYIFLIYWRYISETLKVNGYPSLMLFKDGEVREGFYGNRNLVDLDRFIKKFDKFEYKENAKKQAEAKLDTVSKVLSLNEDNFISTVADHYTFIKFFWPTCGPCKAIAPIWQFMATENNDPKTLKFAEVNCKTDESLCKKHEINGYPTLRLFKEGHLLMDFQGKRTLENLKEFIKKNVSGIKHEEL